LAATAVLALAPLSRAADKAGWKEIKGKHFIVKYVKSEKFAIEVLTEAEKLYSSITARLGFTRYDNFWLWDERAKIWLYPDRESYIKGENAPGWAAGKAVLKGREIRAVETKADFCVTVRPHELSHLIFREFTGLGKDVPAWLDEGVAQLQEKDRKKGARVLAAARAQGKLIPLKKLTVVRPEQLSGSGPAIFYAESLSVVDFMIGKHGSSRFRKFCGELKEGKGVEDALRFTYPGSISSMDHLEKAWLKHLEESK
jgi:hypothetical protein